LSNFPQFTAAFVCKRFSLWHNPERKNCISYKGEIQSTKGLVGIEFCFVDKTLISFPNAFILTRDNPNIKPFHFPHLNANWQLCFDEGVKVFDKFRPKDMVTYCVERVKYVINSTTPHDMDEIIREFNEYWKPNKIYFGDILPDSSYAKLQQYKITAISEKEFDSSKYTNQYMPIYKVPEIPEFSNIDWPIDNFLDLRLWLNDLSDINRKIIKHIKKRIRQYSTQFIILFYTEKEKYYFGIEFELKSPLMQKKHKPHLQETTINRLFNNNCHLKNRLWVSNYTPAELITSNTESTVNLMNKNILLIGAGTIGSNLANMLVRNGGGADINGSLSIIDNDNFEPCNFSRHFLGLNSTGLSKAEALRNELIRIAPFCNIFSVNESVYTSTVFNKQFDLIIDTTGEEALSIWLHEKLYNQNTVVISTWVRGRGEAVESFVLNSRDNGCHQCFRMSDSAIKYYGEEFPLRGSCGSVFVPFSISASVYASLLTIEIINKWIVGDLVHNFFRQKLNPISGIESKTIKKKESCLVCGINFTTE